MTKPNWIPLSETLPPEQTEVLITDGKNWSAAKLGSVNFTPKGKRWLSWTGCGFSGYEWEFDFEPTHWAEAPELFKEEQSNANSNS